MSVARPMLDRRRLTDAWAWLMSSQGSLQERAVRGSIWVFLGRGSSKAIGVAKVVVLARLLAPGDFGLMGIAMFALACLEVFTETGFHVALVQRADNIRPYLDVAWTFQLLRALVIAAVLALAAPAIAGFFEQPAAASVIAAVGLVMILRALVNPASVYFTKDLDFNKLFWLDLAEVTVGLAVAVPLALANPNVWALMISVLAGQGARVALSYVIRPYLPRPSLDYARLRELVSFGRWVFGSNILLFLTNRAGDLVVGKALGATALGFYQVAYRLASMPTTEVVHVISQAVFPAYARVHRATAELRRWYLATLQFSVALATLFTLLLVLLSRELVHVVLGPAWAPMLPAFQVLCGYGLVRAYAATTGPLFQAAGRPDLVTKFATLQVVLIVVLLVPLTARWGTPGAALAMLVSVAIPQALATVRIAVLLEARLGEVLRPLGLPLVASVPVLGLFLLLRHAGGHDQLGPALARLVLFCAVYGATALLVRGRMRLA